MHYAPLAILFLISTALACYVIFLLWPRRAMPGAASLVWLMAGVAWWSLTAGLEMAAQNIPGKVFWSQMSYIGVTSVPVFFFIFTLRYTHRERWLTRPCLAALWIIPILSVILAFTNKWHGLIWPQVTVGSELGGRSVFFTHGIAYWVMVVYLYGLMLASSMLLLRSAFQMHHPFRMQTMVILLGVPLPWLANILYQLGLSPIPGEDLAPFAFTFTGLLFTLGIYRFQLFDLAPLARERVIEIMNDSILVLDGLNRIVDMNPAFRKLLGNPPSLQMGQSATLVLPAWLSDTAQRLSEIQSGTLLDVDGRDIELQVTPIFDSSEHQTGTLLMLRDVSERQQAERALGETNARLHAQINEINALQAMLREQAIRDPVTGLYNRRYLDETLGRELARADRGGYPISLVVIDIDYFKQFNDTLGHDAGDRMLQSLAVHLQAHCRMGDIACRYGGDEFILLLPGLNAETALRRTDEWRVSFEEIQTTHGEYQLRTTFSAGIATYPAPCSTAEAILQAADRALYQAKRGGRNQVIVYKQNP